MWYPFSGTAMIPNTSLHTSPYYKRKDKHLTTQADGMYSALSLTTTKENVLCQLSKRVRFTTSSHVILLTWADNEHCSKLRDLWLNSTPITPNTSDASLALNRLYDIAYLLQYCTVLHIYEKTQRWNTMVISIELHSNSSMNDRSSRKC